MPAIVVPIGSPVLGVLPPARIRMAGKRCQGEPGLPGTSTSGQLAWSCSHWKETLETL